MEHAIVGDIVHYYPDEGQETKLAASRRLRGGPFAAIVVDVQYQLVASSPLLRCVLTLRVFAHEARRDRLVRDVQCSAVPYPGCWTPREARNE